MWRAKAKLGYLRCSTQVQTISKYRQSERSISCHFWSKVSLRPLHHPVWQGFEEQKCLKGSPGAVGTEVLPWAKSTVWPSRMGARQDPLCSWRQQPALVALWPHEAASKAEHSKKQCRLRLAALACALLKTQNLLCRLKYFIYPLLPEMDFMHRARFKKY